MNGRAPLDALILYVGCAVQNSAEKVKSEKLDVFTFSL